MSQTAYKIWQYAKIANFPKICSKAYKHIEYLITYLSQSST